LCDNASAEALTASELGEVGALDHFAEFGEFWRFCDSRRPHGGNDYALIAAMSG
jgi:hypothetical protein